jgi:hypothetical protein
VTAGEITDEVRSGGLCLEGLEVLTTAVGSELDAPIVSTDGDFTHAETKKTIDIEEY